MQQIILFMSNFRCVCYLQIRHTGLCYPVHISLMKNVDMMMVNAGKS